MAGRIGLGKRFRHEIRIGEQFGQPVRDPCELAFERIGGFQDAVLVLQNSANVRAIALSLVSQP